MTIATLSLTETTRLNFQNLDTSSGLPRLPHIPESLFDPENGNPTLTAEQQEANLLHVALWIVERDQGNFDMDSWHGAPNIPSHLSDLPTTANECGTVHCIAGFAQVMAGEVGFSEFPEVVGEALLGHGTYDKFFLNNEEGLAFLEEVIQRNS